MLTAVSATNWHTAALVAGGFIAGVVNTLAGGGSLLTVPLLVLYGLPGNIANGTNRIAVLVQSAVAAWRFRAEGVSGFRAAGPLIAPLLLGSLIGALAISRVAPETFEHLFGLVMLVLLVPILRATRTDLAGARQQGWSRATTLLVFFVIGLYGGAFQAGVGIFLVLALAHVGHGLVLSNSIKTILVTAFTAVAVAVFVLQGQVVWLPAVLLSISTAAGAAVGTRIAVRGGDEVIRPLLAVAVIAMAGKMLGFY
jgi:uncharacterized membrane protein YfcA